MPSAFFFRCVRRSPPFKLSSPQKGVRLVLFPDDLFVAFPVASSAPGSGMSSPRGRRNLQVDPSITSLRSGTAVLPFKAGRSLASLPVSWSFFPKEGDTDLAMHGLCRAYHHRRPGDRTMGKFLQSRSLRPRRLFGGLELSSGFITNNMTNGSLPMVGTGNSESSSRKGRSPVRSFLSRE